MNDITLASDTLQYILFADDTSIFLSGNNLQRLVANFNIELEKIAQWLNANKLILNINKTNYMVFTNKHIDNADIEVKINGDVIKCCNSLKICGCSN